MRQTGMDNVKRTVQGWSTADGRLPANPFAGATFLIARSLIVTAIVALAGCATPERPRDLAPPVHVSESTWRQVDRDIGAASLAATGSAGNYARGAMARWRELVAARAEADFIPWFTGYWTQQWLAIKLAWYKLGSGEDKDPTVTRLAAYLQVQYRDRVLAPVSTEIDPDVVREQATRLYVQSLGGQLRAIPGRYGVPPYQFDRRLKGVPAISLAPPPAHNASLFQVVHADPITGLPAYAALIAGLRAAARGAGYGPADDSLSPVAKQASEKLAARLATVGGASAAAAVVGGIPGILISLGATGFGVIAHEKARPEMEKQVRESLNAALDGLWHILMEDPATGVMAGVHYLSAEIEASFPTTFAEPVAVDKLPEERPLPDKQEFQGEQRDDGAGADQ
jgi:hypothetical protein